MTFRFLLFVALCLASATVFAQSNEFQRKLSLRPMVQLSWSLSDYNSEENTPSFFKLVPSSDGQLGVAGSLGLLIDYQASPKIQLTTGIYKAPLGYGFVIDAPNDALMGGKQLRLAHQAHILAWQLPLQLSYDLVKIQTLGNKEESNYIIRFKLKGIVGASFNQSRRGLDLYTLGAKASTDYIEVNMTNNNFTRTNMGFLGGIGLQFFNKLGKDGFRLDFLYSQGMRPQVTLNLNYDVNNVYTGTVAVKTKGSWFGMRLSHPIGIKTWQ